jgi:hypothetical protein
MNNKNRFSCIRSPLKLQRNFTRKHIFVINHELQMYNIQMTYSFLLNIRQYQRRKPDEKRSRNSNYFCLVNVSHYSSKIGTLRFILNLTSMHIQIEIGLSEILLFPLVTT